MSDRPTWPRQAFVAGEWRGAARTFPVRNPATGETLAEVADCGADEARQALEAAVEVFPAWKNTPGAERSRIRGSSAVGAPLAATPLASWSSTRTR